MHASFLAGHLNQACPTNVEWSNVRGLPPHDIAFGLYATQMNMLVSSHALASSSLSLHSEHEALKFSTGFGLDRFSVFRTCSCSGTSGGDWNFACDTQLRGDS